MGFRRLVSILPIEVRHRIWIHSIPSYRSSSYSTTTPFELNPNTSAPTSILTESTSPSSSNPIFESPNQIEYSRVPPSKLDTSHAPRTSTESLIELLRKDDFGAASTLLQELQQQSSMSKGINKDYVFAFYGHRQLKRRGIDSDWLEWWKLTPTLVYDHHSYEVKGDLRKSDKGLLHRSRQVARKLVEELEDRAMKDVGVEEEGGGNSLLRGGQNRLSKARIVDMMVEFGQVLAKQGHGRVVVEQFLKPIMFEDGIDKAARLWETTLGELRKQSREFKVVDSLEKEKKVELEQWFIDRTQEAYKAIVSSREQMIRIQANLSQLDLAVDLLLSTSQYPSLNNPSKPIKLSRPFYLSIIALLSTHDRYDLMERVYRHLESGDRRLTRVRNEELKCGPYFVRGLQYERAGKDPIPTAKEVFMSFRYQHAVSSIEEGDEAEEWELDNVIGGQEYGTMTTRSQIQSKLLLRLVSTNRINEAVSKLLSLLTHGPLPSAHSVATLLHHLESNHDFSRHGQEVVRAIEEHVSTSHWRRGFFQTCRMLTDLQSTEEDKRKLVVRRFRDYFELYPSLPPAMISAIKLVTLRMPSVRKSEMEEEEEEEYDEGEEEDVDVDEGGKMKRQKKKQTKVLKKSIPNAYTTSILMQALVPILEELPRTSGGHRLLRNVYESCLDPDAFKIVPVHRQQRKPFSNGTASSTTKKSPLDPYTFLPFIYSSLSRKSSQSPLEILLILSTMHGRLGLDVPMLHLSLLTSSYARWGSLKDFDWLFKCIERGGYWVDSGESAYKVRPPSKEIVEFVQSIFPPLPPSSSSSSLQSKQTPLPTPLSPSFYSTLLKSLRLRNAHSTAMEILQRYMDRLGGPEGFKKLLMEVDKREVEGLRREVGLLGRISSSGGSSREVEEV